MMRDSSQPLEIDGLSVVYPTRHGDVTAVRGASLQVAAGEIVALVGESGSGKTTITKAALGLLEGATATGSVRVAGAELVGISHRARRDLYRQSIAIILQDPVGAINPVRTIRSQLIESARAAGIDRDSTITAIERVLRDVDLEPARVLRRLPHELSGGMNQRVAVAMALLKSPKLLIADEPTSALDVRTQAAVMRLLRRIGKERGTGILLVTHDLGLALQECDRVAVMKDGEIVEFGPTENIAAKPKHPYSQALLAASPHFSDFSREPSRHASHGLPTPLIELNNVGVDLGGRPVLSEVTLSLGAGEAIAVVGESGAGKSTLGRLILGLTQWSRGDYLWKGEKVASLRREKRTEWRRHCQAVFQNPTASLNPRLTVERALTEPLEATQRLSRAQRRARAEELLVQVGLPPEYTSRLPHQLSGGQRQRVVIARALSTDPSVLVLDEPVSALDVSARRQIIDLLVAIRRERGTAMVFVTHDLATIGPLVDRVAVMYEGLIVEQLTIAQLHGEPKHRYTRELVSAVIATDKAASAASRTN